MDVSFLIRWSRVGLALTTTVLLLLAPEGSRCAEDAKPGEQTLPLPEVSPPGHPPMVLDLVACRRLALEKQPALAVYRASLANAQARLQAVEALHVPNLIRPDLPIRRQQAATAVCITDALVCQAEWETLYSVTRTFAGVYYAQEQERALDETLQRLERFKEEATNDATKDRPSGGNNDKRDKGKKKQYVDPIIGWEINRAIGSIGLAKARREEARAGRLRALAALREAIGLEPLCCLEVVVKELPTTAGTPCRVDLVAAALHRRGEIFQTEKLAEVISMEADAQGLLHGASVPTFASGSDIHATQVPAGIRDHLYRPAAIPPEMPTNLVGSKEDRVAQAHALADRAHAVVEKTRSLITLEVEEAYYNWMAACRQLPELRQGWEAARNIPRQLRSATRNAPKELRDPDFTEIPQELFYPFRFDGGRLLTDLQTETNRALYDYLLAVAALERATAGGFCPTFAPPPPPLPPVPEPPPPTSKKP
jgi:outer membrane protein TolC